jgi:hypothetical protein
MIAGGDRAPSVGLPLRYLVAAAVAFVLAALGVAWLAPELAGHYYHPRVFALAHTVSLGWITLTILGSSYQLVPIVLGRPLWSERLARWQFVVLVIGLVGLIAHFFIAEWRGLAWAAAMVALAAAAHGVNIAMTVRGLAEWSFTARLVTLGHVGLALTAASGLALGIDKAWKFLPGGTLANLHAHVHLALLGWVLPMVIGVAARVYPMFLLAPPPGGFPASVQLWGLALGVPVIAVGLASEVTMLARLGALAVAAVVAAHLWWIAAFVRRRKRPQLDWPLRLALTGAAFAVPATLVGLGLAFDLLAGPRVATSYVVLVFGGWASLTIAGMMLKIVPFLVWYRAYGGRVGRAPVPTLADLGCRYAEAAAYTLLTAGFIALPLAIGVGEALVIRVAGVITAAGAIAFALGLARVLAHLWRPMAGAAPHAACRQGAS